MNKNIDGILSNLNDTIKQVMEKINNAPRKGHPTGISLIVDDKKHLLGIVTDGDIRRSLIKGIELDKNISEIMVKEPITIKASLSPEKALREINNKLEEAIAKKRLKEHKVSQVIVLDNENRVVGISSFFEIWKKSDVKLRNVCIIGMGFVGLTLAVTLADFEFNVLGYDINKQVLEELEKGKPHFHEKNLDFILKRNLNKNLFLTNKLESKNNDIYVICVGTPIGENNKPDLSAIKMVSQTVSKVLKEGDLIILRSTVPVGTCRNIILPILENASNLTCGKDFYLSFAPERTIEGKALEELKSLPQVIGGFSDLCLDLSSSFFRKITPNIVAIDSLEEAELVKLINNSFRDVSFAFANEFVLICDKFNLNAAKIIKAANEGYPRNNIPVPGFVGGYCLKKDPLIYANVAEKFDIYSKLTPNSRLINDNLINYTYEKMNKFCKNNNLNIKQLKTFILGFAFKGIPETSDIRDSPTIDLLNILNKNGWNKIYGFDPVVSKHDIEKLGVFYCTIDEGFQNADIIVIMNNHPYFGSIDIVSLLEITNKPCLLFDGWSIYNPKEIAKVKGIIYHGLGFKLNEEY